MPSESGIPKNQRVGSSLKRKQISYLDEGEHFATQHYILHCPAINSQFMKMEKILSLLKFKL